MRNLLFIFALGMLLTSCSDDEVLTNATTEQSPKFSVVSVVDGQILPMSRSDDNSTNAFQFDNRERFEEFKIYLAGMTDEERLEFVNNCGVETLHNLADAVDEELDSIGAVVSSEAEFRLEYNALVNRYRDLLITNQEDETDLDLYVPDGDNVESYIANGEGVFIVGNNLERVELEPVITDIILLPGSGNDSRSPGIGNAPTHVNSYVVSPKRHKRVYFSVSRRYNYIHISMQTKKKMWYGWKNDSHRDLLFEPRFSTLNVQWIGPYYTRYWAKSKKKLEVDLLQTPVKTLTGTIYTWTDMTAEYDANGNLIMQQIGNTTTPKCSYDKAEIVSVNLPL